MELDWKWWGLWVLFDGFIEERKEIFVGFETDVILEMGL